MAPQLKLTMDMVAEVERLLPIVHYIETIGDYLGVHRSTWRNWISLGRAEAESRDRTGKEDPKREIHFRFYKAYRKGLAQAEVNNLIHINQAAQTQWQAAAWILERRYPKKWARKEIEQAAQSALTDLMAQIGMKSLNQEQLANYWEPIEAQIVKELESHSTPTPQQALPLPQD